MRAHEILYTEINNKPIFSPIFQLAVASSLAVSLSEIFPGLILILCASLHVNLGPSKARKSWVSQIHYYLKNSGVAYGFVADGFNYFLVNVDFSSPNDLWVSPCFSYQGTNPSVLKVLAFGIWLGLGDDTVCLLACCGPFFLKTIIFICSFKSMGRKRHVLREVETVNFGAQMSARVPKKWPYAKIGYRRSSFCG